MNTIHDKIYYKLNESSSKEELLQSSFDLVSYLEDLSVPHYYRAKRHFSSNLISQLVLDIYKQPTKGNVEVRTENIIQSINRMTRKLLKRV